MRMTIDRREALKIIDTGSSENNLPYHFIVDSEVRLSDNLHRLELRLDLDGESTPYKIILHRNGCWALIKEDE